MKTKEILKQMEDYAKEKRICIVLPDTREFLINLCQTRNPKKILEVGTAIGFSASLMLLNSSANITCFEASAPNIVLAKQNFEKLGLTDRVQIVFGDCLKTLPNCKEKFDLIFLDGPKGLYPDILKLLLPLLEENGIFVADNVSFRGMVNGKNSITEKRFEKTVLSLQMFLNDLKSNKDLDVKVFEELGDGIAIATWRKKWKILSF